MKSPPKVKPPVPEGWVSPDGFTYTMELAEPPPSPPIVLNLTAGAVATFEEASRQIIIYNRTSSAIPYSGVNQISGHVIVCSCNEGESLNLSSIEPNSCFRLKILPSSDSSIASFKLTGLFEVTLSATVEGGSTPPAGGLVIGGTCN